MQHEQVAITVRFRRKNAVVMRTVHAFKVITFRLAKLFQFAAQRGQFVESVNNVLGRSSGLTDSSIKLNSSVFVMADIAMKNSVMRRAKELHF